MCVYICFRGFNAGALRLDNIQLPTGESAIPYLLSEVMLQAGAVLHLLPDHTKNKKGGHCQITLTRDLMRFLYMHMLPCTEAV